MRTLNDSLAPGWRLRCPVCGRNKPAADAGVIRLGAASPFGKSILGRCSSCRAVRKLELYRHETTSELQTELAAYVAEGTMDAATAGLIKASIAPEALKRDIAAYIADGMSPAEGLRLLSDA